MFAEIRRGFVQRKQSWGTIKRMIKIIKEGKKPEGKIIRFVCKNCHTEFEADEENYSVSDVIIYDSYCCKCPVCNQTVYSYENKIEPPTPTIPSYLQINTDPCENCNNNPKNGGDGICCCSLPDMYRLRL